MALDTKSSMGHDFRTPRGPRRACRRSGHSASPSEALFDSTCLSGALKAQTDAIYCDIIGHILHMHMSINLRYVIQKLLLLFENKIKNGDSAN